MYIRHESLSRFSITPKYHPMLFKNIETQKPFAYFLFQLNSVHSMKRTDIYFKQHDIFFIYNKSLVYCHHWNKKTAISHTYFLIPKIQHLTIIFKEKIFSNVISFWYGYMALKICPYIKYYHTKDKFLWLNK